MAQVISRLGADISTDVIYPGRCMATVLPAVVPLPKACQAMIDAGGLIACTRKRSMEAAGRA